MSKFTEAIAAWFNPDPDADGRAAKTAGSPRYIEPKHGYKQREDWVPPHKTLPDDFKVDKYEEYRDGQDHPVATGFEPHLHELGEDITDWDRLIWQAACLYEETGIAVRVYEGFGSTNGYRLEEYIYQLSGPGWGMSGQSFESCWTYMNGMSAAHRLIKDGKSNLTVKEQDEEPQSGPIPDSETPA